MSLEIVYWDGRKCSLLNFTVQVSNTVAEATPDAVAHSRAYADKYASHHIISCHESKPCLLTPHIPNQTRPVDLVASMDNPSAPSNPRNAAATDQDDQQTHSHCRRLLVSLPMSGLALRFPSGRFPPNIPIEGSIGPGLEYPPPIGIDIA